jgi:hypothetical protein
LEMVKKIFPSLLLSHGYAATVRVPEIVCAYGPYGKFYPNFKRFVPQQIMLPCAPDYAGLGPGPPENGCRGRRSRGVVRYPQRPGGTAEYQKGLPIGRNIRRCRCPGDPTESGLQIRPKGPPLFIDGPGGEVPGNLDVTTCGAITSKLPRSVTFQQNPDKDLEAVHPDRDPGAKNDWNVYSHITSYILCGKPALFYVGSGHDIVVQFSEVFPEESVAIEFPAVASFFARPAILGDGGRVCLFYWF